MPIGLDILVPSLLVACLSISLPLHVLSRPKHHQIALPFHADDSLPPFDPHEKPDPFNFHDVEVSNDGVSLDGGDAFQSKMRIIKPVFLVVVLIFSLIHVASFVIALTHPASTPPDHFLFRSVARFLVDTYLLALGFGYLSTESADEHWKATVHLASMLAVLGTGKMIECVLPGDDEKVTAINGWLDYVELGFILIAFIISIFIPRGPRLYLPYTKIYDPKTTRAMDLSSPEPNVSEETSGPIVSQLLFGYSNDVIKLGGSKMLQIKDLPISPAYMRALPLFGKMRDVYRTAMKKKKEKALGEKRTKKKGKGGWMLLGMILKANRASFLTQAALAVVTSAFFINRFLNYLQNDPERTELAWGWVYCWALFLFSAGNYVLTGMLWSVSRTTLESRIKLMLNTMLFHKTLIRKDVAGGGGGLESQDQSGEDEDVTSKSQVQTLMTVDVDRCAEFSFHTFSLVDSPLEIIIGGIFIYNLMGVSAIYGLATTFLFLPVNHWASKYVLTSEENTMKARDERNGLMNEILGGIRMIKYMAWERSFEERVIKIRERELFWQRRGYLLEVIFNGVWACTPVAVTIVALFHYVYFRGMPLTPSVAFTSVSIFRELQFALSALPETFLAIIKGFVSLRRIEKYLALEEIELVTTNTSQKIIAKSVTLTWPRTGNGPQSTEPSAPSTPKNSFVLELPSIECPEGGLTLVCGRLGSGKTLFLKALLGEADLLTGSLSCPRSAPDAMSTFYQDIIDESWIVNSVTAYVPQVAWLQNDSIRNNILFNLPMNEKRYHATLEACSLLPDLEILEDGDHSEIGESGLNLSGGQKARVSLARAVYSRASTIFLDDVLSAVDAHTAHHIYENCLKGPLLTGRTVILVSHHVQLCAPGADYIIALNNGSVEFCGDKEGFSDSPASLDIFSHDPEAEESKGSSSSQATIVPQKEESDSPTDEKIVKALHKVPKKLIEDEKRNVGRVKTSTWIYYLKAYGRITFWICFIAVFVVAMLVPYFENLWLQIWSSDDYSKPAHSPLFYVGVYAAISLGGVVFGSLRFFVTFQGSLSASDKLHRKMLESVLFSTVRFHDTVSKGMLLNRFGKDLEKMDTGLGGDFTNTLIALTGLIVTVVSIASVGGWVFMVCALCLGLLYYIFGVNYGPTSRELRRLDSVTRSPLYSLYAETVTGVSVLRAFGASTLTLRKMFAFADTNIVSYYWTWTSNRWITARYNVLSAAILGATGVAVLLTPSISAATAGFALSFALKISFDMLSGLRRYVGLEQSMIAVERVKEFSELVQEAPEFIEPRPEASWPASGRISVKDLVVKYSPDLPTVLHSVSFEVEPKAKIGIVGPTGCGKSTLALSFFRFIEATSGMISIDGIDISKIGLTDVRRYLTIIPQDPTILSGTLRSTLDVFNEYEDHEIYEALRRVHLIAAEGSEEALKLNADGDEVNANVFKNLDSIVNENGDNFSQGQKQLLCMARAILRRNKILVMDEATASIDYTTDALINKTIREEFSDSTILTIAHRLRTIIDFDKVIVMEAGHLKEYNSPFNLLQDPTSRFYALCQATGKAEFAVLNQLAEVAHEERNQCRL